MSQSTEDYLKAAEDLLTPYEWGRYDVLLLPSRYAPVSAVPLGRSQHLPFRECMNCRPSFPYGGMEVRIQIIPALLPPPPRTVSHCLMY